MRKPRLRRARLQGTPDFKRRRPLPLTEIHVRPTQRLMITGNAEATVKAFKLGECGVILTVADGVHHLSISHPNRYPNWDEIAEARYRVCPDVAYMAIWLPPSDKYVNIHPNCFQMIESEPSDYVKNQRS